MSQSTHAVMSAIFRSPLFQGVHTRSNYFKKGMSSHYSTSPSLEVAVLSQAYSLPHLEAGSQCIFLLGVIKCAKLNNILKIDHCLIH